MSWTNATAASGRFSFMVYARDGRNSSAYEAYKTTSALLGERCDSISTFTATTGTLNTVDLSALATLQAPIFRLVRREQWTGLNHLAVFARLMALADQYRPQHIIIDATGVGEGLWAMLDKQFSTRVIPVKFSTQEKSDIGWRFLSIIETGRFRAISYQPSAISFAWLTACR